MKEKDKRRDVRGESRERAKCQRETLGKYFYDLSKLTFTALVLGGIAMLFQSEKIEISMIGMFMVGILFSVGNRDGRFRSRCFAGIGLVW